MIAPTPGLGASIRIRQGATLGFRHLVATDPSLVLVTKGAKVIRHAGVEIRAGAGDVVGVPAGIACDVINAVEGAEDYVALALTFDRDLLAALPVGMDAPPAIVRPVHIAAPPDGFRAALLRAAEAAEPDSGLPRAVARHRIAEPLTWLPDLIGGRLAAPPPTLPMRLRALLGADPGHPWSGAEAARRLGMSGSAMRRHLAEAGSGFAEILADVRMSRALVLLQTGSSPIAAIAAEVGYQSQSRFAVRFRQRFGFAPTAMRGHHREMSSLAPKSIKAGAPAGTVSASMAPVHAHAIHVHEGDAP